MSSNLLSVVNRDVLLRRCLLRCPNLASLGALRGRARSTVLTQRAYRGWQTVDEGRGFARAIRAVIGCRRRVSWVQRQIPCNRRRFLSADTCSLSQSLTASNKMLAVLSPTCNFSPLLGDASQVESTYLSYPHRHMHPSLGQPRTPHTSVSEPHQPRKATPQVRHELPLSLHVTSRASVALPPRPATLVPGKVERHHDSHLCSAVPPKSCWTP